MNDKILLYGAQFHGRHGVSPAEREIGGRYVVDIEIECDTRRAARLDDLADTVNYSDVFRTIRAVMEGEQFKLLETLAEKIAQTLLGKFPADAVRVRVKKQPPPTAGIVEYTGVEIYRQRQRQPIDDE